MYTVYFFCQAYETFSCRCMHNQGKRWSDWLVVGHHHTALKAGREPHEFSQIVICNLRPTLVAVLRKAVTEK